MSFYSVWKVFAKLFYGVHYCNVYVSYGLAMSQQTVQSSVAYMVHCIESATQQVQQIRACLLTPAVTVRGEQ